MNTHHLFAVAVVIPLYNKAPYIRRTLESVLAQTLPAAEIVIVDDGSTDDSVARISELAGANVRLVVQPNAGPGPARNRGVAAATMPWIAFLDGDDLWRPDHLATLAELSGQFSEADAVATGFDILATGDHGRPLLPSEERLGGALFDYFATGPHDHGICSSSIAIRRATLRETGDFGAFWPGEDREFWTRLALDHQIALSRRRTAFYVQQKGGLMETFESGPSIGFKLQPIFATLDRALADSRYSARHSAIRAYRASLLRQNIRQALFRGEVDAAHQYIAELEKNGPARLGLLRLLANLSPATVRAGIMARGMLKQVSSAFRA